MNPVDVLKAAADRGLSLRINGEKLRVLPADRLSPDFSQILKAHKPALLELLKLRMVIVDSAAIQELLFFCEDDCTRDALCAAGADPSEVYTKAELRVLVAQNRVAPLTAAELRKVHEIKRTFRSRIATDNGG